MKIAISNIAWDRREDEDIAFILQKFGIQGIDVAPGKLKDDPMTLTDAQINKYVNYWDKVGVQIVGMQSMLYGHPELTIFADGADVRAQTSDYLKRIIAIAGKLGVTPMVFGSPKNRQIGAMSYDEAFAIAVDFFRDLAETAAENDTILCIEPNAAEYNCDFITRSNQAIDLVKAVNHEGFGLHLDTAIMTLEKEDIPAALDAALPYLAHFHVSEPYLGAIRYRKNKVDHETIADHLRAIGYDNWVSIEMRGGHSKPDADTVEEAVDVVSAYYA